MDWVYHDRSREEEVNAFLKVWQNQEECIHCFSSGSTGEPKSIALHKEDMRISAKKTLDTLGIKPGAHAGLALSTETIAGKMMVVRALIGNLNLHILPVNSEPLRGLTIELDFLSLVPLQAYQSIGKVSIQNQQATVLVGGAPITHIQFNAIRDYWKKSIHTYGMTETVSHVALRSFSDGFDAPFCALPGLEFSTNEDRLIIHSQDFSFKTIETSDLVSLIDEKRFRFLGRADFVMNINGKKINPETIETALSESVAIPFVVVPYEDDVFGQSVGILFEAEYAIGIKDALQHIALPSSVHPRKFQVHPSFFRTKSGKLDRRRLWEAAKSHDWKPLL
jgi:O-succinylbenzoic acid--CoA ligase